MVSHYLFRHQINAQSCVWWSGCHMRRSRRKANVGLTHQAVDAESRFRLQWIKPTPLHLNQPSYHPAAQQCSNLHFFAFNRGNFIIILLFKDPLKWPTDVTLLVRLYDWNFWRLKSERGFKDRSLWKCFIHNNLMSLPHSWPDIEIEKA